LSIRPEFVERIFAGTKRYELRRVVFSESVRTVVVYATAPVGRVVGEFDVGAIYALAPSALWEAVKPGAGIDEQSFKAYFDGCQVGHAIEIAAVTSYPHPLPIGAFTARPPQSFVYL